MANIFDYIAWRGDLRFDFRPFNELDGLVLCRMSYLPCDNILGEAPMSLPELADALINPLIRKSEKRDVIEKLFPQSVWSFVKVMSDNDDIACSSEMFEAYDQLVREKENTIKAVFTYVTKPDDAQIKSLKSKIAKDYGKEKVELRLEEDPSIIGGFILTVGEEVFDQSIRTSMAKMKRHFAER